MQTSVTPNTQVRAVSPDDAAGICQIYNHYVLSSTITFEELPVAVEQMQQRILANQHANFPWLVACDDQQAIAGYAYASQWKARSAYRHSVEITVYVAPHAQGHGIATRLYQQLFQQLRQQEIHLAIAGIALPNQASIALHERFGMRQVGVFNQVGRKLGQWVDVGYWQLTLSQ